MSEPRCPLHAVPLVAPVPFCPKCRGKLGGKQRTAKQQASAKKTLEQYRDRRWAKR